MSSIKFNQMTKEIEMTGSESFIESNFDKIQDLLIERFGMKKMLVSRKAKETQEPISLVKMEESPDVEIKRNELADVSSILPATESSIPEIPHELKANRPPLRKYIRKVGIPGHQRIVVQVVEQKQREVSVASLKEKFGVSESKLEGIFRDAEKLGKIRKAMGGTYVWMQD